MAPASGSFHAPLEQLSSFHGPANRDHASLGSRSSLSEGPTAHMLGSPFGDLFFCFRHPILMHSASFNSSSVLSCSRAHAHMRSHTLFLLSLLVVL
jgi:hypothetical protein